MFPHKHKAQQLCNVSDGLVSTPVISGAITGKKNDWRRHRGSQVNYKMTLEKGTPDALEKTPRRECSSMDTLTTPLPHWPLWKLFPFSFLSFFFSFSIRADVWHQLWTTQKNSFCIFVSSSCVKLHLTGGNPSIHDLLACQEIFRTFFCITCMNSPQSRRQQTFSLSLVLLQTITS